MTALPKIRIIHPLAALCLALVTLCLLAAPRPAAAHDMPFSALDLDLRDRAIQARLEIDTALLARELGFDEPHDMIDVGLEGAQRAALERILRQAISLEDDEGRPIALRLVYVRLSHADPMALLVLRSDTAPPPVLVVDAALFPREPAHQTIVNLREDGALAQQMLFAADTAPQSHYAGTAAGALAVLATFIPAGAWHVAIGPDHVLFLVGLILLGGTLRRLALIVTAFTIGHSITLALAATGVLVPPAWLIEPLIALSIVVVGADNLLRKPGERDLRALFALVFGLVHGFGFAFVLREFGLPPGQLALSLFAFNLGVELAQLAIVLLLSALLVALRARAPRAARVTVVIASLAVIAAGLYWLVDRVLFAGSGAG